MEVLRNERTETWHLLGARGCGVEPDGDRLDGSWATLRDHVERDDADRCENCNWPSSRRSGGR